MANRAKGKPVVEAKGDTTPCRVCRKSIPVGALKCTECDSFQDWRRHLNLSSTVLSLLVALISVSTVAFPIFQKALHKPRSDVRVALVQYGPIDANAASLSVGKKKGQGFARLTYSLPIVVLVTNSGDLPGSVVPKGIKLFRGRNTVAKGDGAEAILVDPKSSRLHTFRFTLVNLNRSVFPAEFFFPSDGYPSHSIEISDGYGELDVMQSDISLESVRLKVSGSIRMEVH
jgi:hypothetical protein